MSKQSEIKAFLDSILYQMEAMVSFLIPKEEEVRLKLNIGGGSYTDGKVIQVGLPEIYYDKSEAEQFAAIMALVGHECAHIIWSNFDDYKDFGKWAHQVFLYRNGDYRIAQVGEKFALMFMNAVEDGRIERLLCSSSPGYTKYIQALNGTFHLTTDIEKMNEVQAYILTVCSLATTGVYPRRFSEVYKGSELEKAIKVIEKDILNAIKQTTSKGCVQVCKAAFLKNIDYITSLLLKELDVAENIDFTDEFTCNETSSNDNSQTPQSFVSPHFVPEKQDEKEKENEKVEGNENKQENSTKTEKKKANEDSKENGKVNGSGSENSEENEENNEEANEENSGSVNKKENKPENGEEETQGSGNIISSTEADIEELIKQAQEVAKQDAEKKMQQQNRKEEEEEEEDYKLTQEDLASIMEEYKEETVKDFDEVPRSWHLYPLPQELRPLANRLKKEFENFFKNKKVRNFRHQSSGKLVTKDLWRIGMQDYNVFAKNSHPMERDFVVEICWDGSGSMYGANQKFSAHACAIIEEALKPYVPLKIINFCTDDKVYHFVVKDFSDKDKNVNYAYSFNKYRFFDGCNKDGYTIRVATKELLKRPERDKLLIILSDGEPTDYNGGPKVGREDVKKAVKEARQQGIYVLTIFFGSDFIREASIENYKYMYEKNIISCPPEQIPSQLIKAMKKLLMR